MLEVLHTIIAIKEGLHMFLIIFLINWLVMKCLCCDSCFLSVKKIPRHHICPTCICLGIIPYVVDEGTISLYPVTKSTYSSIIRIVDHLTKAYQKHPKMS